MKDHYGNELAVGDEVEFYYDKQLYNPYISYYLGTISIIDPSGEVLINQMWSSKWMRAEDLVKWNSHKMTEDLSEIKESACGHCGSMNDIGVPKCWSCEQKV
jgi:hypothetical protein